MHTQELGWKDALTTGMVPTIIDTPAQEVGDLPDDVAPGSVPVLVVAHRLQDEADYRGALQGWFDLVAPGGQLVLLVSHAFLRERQLALPVPGQPRQRRLYTPRVLLDEVEEALVPNSYRVRHLADLDQGLDYAAADASPPAGQGDILLVLEKIHAPGWQPLPVARPFLSPPEPSAPDYAFEPERTRVEVSTAAAGSIRRIFVIKPDHVGDLIMSLGALERLRALFPTAHITLLVGSWNADMARALGLADEVIAFDVFPRNSTEEEVDVAGRTALFRAAVPGRYDLAIDLRSDTDTRFLLGLVDAALRAGIGTRGQFPFLDIFLPLDFNRNWVEAASETRLDHHAFASHGSVMRGEYRIMSEGDRADRHGAIIWGPYHRLRPGRYLFDPFLEIAPGQQGLLMLDIALDTRRVTQLFTSAPGPVRLSFAVDAGNPEYEFRIFAVDQDRALDFSFFGGRLIREGAQGVLHQSEYQQLLVELVAIKLGRTGMLQDAAFA